MYKRKLCLGVGDFGISAEEQLVRFKKAGFDGFFIGWENGMELRRFREIADREGLLFQSVHAPYQRVRHMWEKSAEADNCTFELINCVHECEKNRVPIMVTHAFIGFEEHCPSEIGLCNFEKVVNEAKKCGVRIAFENTEGEEYLDALMEHFGSFDNVGFCWDTGHELCYNRGRDMLKDYGDRLICTHLNDNLGIKNFDGEITWLDDLHLLPFDGVIAWHKIAERLNKCGYDDALTFELNTVSKPGRCENNKYAKLPTDEYLAECYARACKVAYMCTNI